MPSDAPYYKITCFVKFYNNVAHTIIVSINQISCLMAKIGNVVRVKMYDYLEVLCFHQFLLFADDL